MPYHKNKVQAFQSAQNGVRRAVDAHENLESMQHDPQFGHEVGHLWEEINEAYQQVENAYEVASEHQKDQLDDYRNTLDKMVSDLDKFEKYR
ncbi:hypothetical protein F7984_08935 [Pradoshia sp. D12]|uniref:hypothetical protein n=1 Tax=Bacillaceae TaxID=186817 RepID=UPI00080AD370|nr:MULTISPECIES: hypothetical protein [Bacillaceae]OCA86880.1 hypothetical protein A8L44_06280 [Bacillus sp. FJAT-27986]QFK71347.1 hypothetical protein F7984_08935 [Pradoshia sp. D12]TPF73142.1 hypothetical protein FHY44_05330 [Bacillus sp. D12]